MVQIRRHFLTVGERQLHVRTAGSGPALVMLPDVPGGFAAMEGTVQALADVFQVVVVDLPGTGNSSPLQDGRADRDQLIDAVVDGFEAMGLPRPLLYGRGVGAALALTLAVAYPDRVSGLVLDELQLLDADERRRWTDREVALSEPALDGSHLVRAFHRVRDQWLFSPWFEQDEVTRPVDMPAAETLHTMTMDILAGVGTYHRLRQAALGSAVPDLLARVPVPTTAFTLGAAEVSAPDHVQVRSIEDLRVHRADPGSAVRDVLDASAAEPAAPVFETVPLLEGIARCYLDSSHGQIHLRMAGDPASTKRPLIMLHSAPGSAEPLEAAMLGLSSDRLVLAPDFLGNGDSDKPDPDQSLDIAFLAGVLVEALATLDHEHFDLWGSHTGGLIAMEMAIAVPERFNAMILDAVPLLDPAETADILENYLPEIVPDVHGTHLLAAWHMRRDMFLYWPWYNRKGTAVRPMLLPDVQTFHAWTMGLLRSGTTYHLSYRAAFEYPTAERLPLLDLPTLLCSGPTDMLADGLEQARELGSPSLDVQPTPSTVWYPRQPEAAVEETLRIYRRFLDR